MVERGEEKEETDEQTDGPTVSPSLRELLILSFSVPSSRVTSSPAVDARPVFLSHRAKMRESASFSSSLFLCEDSRRERDAASRGIRRGFRHYTSSIRLSFSLTSPYLPFLTNVLFQHVNVANLLSLSSFSFISFILIHENC